MGRMGVLQERLHARFSAKTFGLTFGGLVLAGLLASTASILLSSAPKFDLTVTVPLGIGTGTGTGTGTATASHETIEPISAGELSDDDRAAHDPNDAPLGTAAAQDDKPQGEEPGQSHGEPPAKHADHKDAQAPATPQKPVIEDAVAGLHQTTPYGMVPVRRAADDLTAFKAYQSHFTPAPATRALVSLVMVDYGLSSKASALAVQALPPGVTFTLSPYSRDSQKMVAAARQDGHEVWLGLPLQSKDYLNNDSGNQTLLVNAGPEQNKTRLLANLGKATGYVGVVDLQSPAFDARGGDLNSIYTDIVERGLGLAQADPKDTLTGEFAISRKAPFIQNDIWIDEVSTAKGVEQELDKLHQLALSGHVAVGFFHPYPAVIKAIADWQVELEKDNIQLAPLSASIEQKSK